jgi:hypothetical protein
MAEEMKVQKRNACPLLVKNKAEGERLMGRPRRC